MSAENKDLKMSEKAKQAQKAYMREWRRKNRDKMKEYNRRYWERKAREHSKDE